MNFTITAIQAIEWIIRFLAVYTIIDSAEKLYNFRELRNNGFFSWQFLRKNRFFSLRSAFTRKLMDHIFDFPGWISLLALRSCSGLLLLLKPHQSLLAIVCLLVLFIVGSLINFRNTPFGTETENRFALMLSGALLLRSILPTELITEVCLWFIALQSCISYVTAGITKWVNKEWRKGNALLHVINSPDLVPSERIRLFFSQQQWFGRLLAWTTIIVECLFPLVLIVGQPFFWAFLIWGIVFHLTIALFLRLGKFFWVWIATYPAIIFIAQ